MMREDDGAEFLAAACGPTPPASLPAPLPALPGRVVPPSQAPMNKPGAAALGPVSRSACAHGSLPGAHGSGYPRE